MRPHWRQLDGNGTAGIDTGNLDVGTSNGNTNRDVGGTVFSVPYAYTKQTAANTRTAVINCSGPQPIR